MQRVQVVLTGSSGWRHYRTAPPRARSDVPPATVTPETFNRDDIRMAAIPSSGGIMTARALARHYAVLAQGGTLDGVRLLTPERISLATELQTAAVDELYSRRSSAAWATASATTRALSRPRRVRPCRQWYVWLRRRSRQFAVAFLRNYAARRQGRGGAPCLGHQCRIVLKSGSPMPCCAAVYACWYSVLAVVPTASSQSFTRSS